MTGFAYAGAEVGIAVIMTRGLQQGRVQWVLPEEVDYTLPMKAGGSLQFTIRAGAKTDGVSNKWWLTWLVPVVEYSTFLPAALHDQLFDQHQAEKAAGANPTWSRADVDHVFREALRAEGVGKPKRWAMWAAVRLQAWWTRDV